MDSTLNISPLVTVLMPVYNCEKYIFEAVQSILNQTFGNFEFLIIDDCSTDNTLEICKSFQDERIIIIEKKINYGISIVLNYGLSIAKGKYIARMDGDDISLPERFAKQVAFMEANDDVVVCGTALKILNTKTIICYSEYSDQIMLEMLERNCIIHPSSMIRKTVILEHSILYDVNKEPAEDYNLWIKLSKYGKLHNLQEVLINYRVHQNQVSQMRNKLQIKHSVAAQLSLLKLLNIEFDELIVSKAFNFNYDFTSKLEFSDIEYFSKFKSRIIIANKNCFFDPLKFEKFLEKLQRKILKQYFFKRQIFSPLIFIQYLSMRRLIATKFSKRTELALLIKSILYWNVKKV